MSFDEIFVGIFSSFLALELTTKYPVGGSNFKQTRRF